MPGPDSGCAKFEKFRRMDICRSYVVNQSSKYTHANIWYSDMQK